MVSSPLASSPKVSWRKRSQRTACALVADPLADMGAHQPYVLTSHGDILIDRLGDFRSDVTGWDG
ncbi:hypothetical protein GCM10011583_70170 [Streptomyces camponoticapitis]|uniref:Uncharacterized protein n=1 Tax=Streptomyces camponoticapitis TaxID=1616125 RepID=A0ABQ2EVA1_9ACTN|nr:hypothetical protein GCM10011583_70170 [Streptomyces camponoticapitis]